MSNLSDVFLAYLRSDQPKFGTRDDFPAYFELWAEADLETFNSEYEVPKYAAGFYAFGGDGGGEILAFGKDGQVYVLPCIGMAPEAAILVSDSWETFRSSFK